MAYQKTIVVICAGFFCGMMLSACQRNNENNSALQIIEDQEKYDEEGSFQKMDNGKHDDEIHEESQAKLKDVHIITHNQNYRVPLMAVESKQDKDGVTMDGAFSYLLPEGFVSKVIEGSLVYVMEEELGSHSLYIYTEHISNVQEEDVLNSYDLSIKEEFGSDAEIDQEKYNGLAYRHYLFEKSNDGEHGFINIFIYVNETELIYIEFYDTANVFDEIDISKFMENVSLIQ